MNSTTATAFSINATRKDYCRDKFGHWCLGKHLLEKFRTGFFTGLELGLQYLDQSSSWHKFSGTSAKVAVQQLQAIATVQQHQCISTTANRVAAGLC